MSGPEGFGTAAMLDAVCGDRPAFLTAKSLHAAWANSRALAMAGIDASTPDPPGGTIQRDPEGNPKGILLEGEATKLVESVIPQPSVDSLAASFKALFQELWQMGLVGVHDFDGYDCWLALQKLQSKWRIAIPGTEKRSPFDHLERLYRGEPSNRFLATTGSTSGMSNSSQTAHSVRKQGQCCHHMKALKMWVRRS